MLRTQRWAFLTLAGVVSAGAVVFGVVAISSGPTYIRPPLLCAATGMALRGPDLWVSGCAFKTRSAFSSKVPAIVELNADTGSLIRTVTDRDAGNDGPAGLAISDARVWVANGDGNSVVELDARSGSMVRVIKRKTDRFESPWAIAANSSHVWVFNAGNFTITELSATNGSLERVIGARADELASVTSMTVVGDNLWLTNGTTVDNSVVELNAQSGALKRVIHDHNGDLNEPSSLVVRGETIWVTSDQGPVATTPLADGNSNWAGGSVTELDAKTGLPISVIDAKKDDFFGSQGIALSKSRIWVGNPEGDSMTVLNSATGALVRVISAKADRLGGPGKIIVRGPDVWVLDSDELLSKNFDVWGGALTELNAANGELVRVIR